MLTRQSTRQGRDKNVNDRHLNKGDRHKEKHVDHHSTKDSGHRCICGYAKCNEVRDGFMGTGHAYDRPPIRFIHPKQCEEWDDFCSSLIRNLHVPEGLANSISSSGQGSRFDVCAHHFTEEVVGKYYDVTNKHKEKKIWAKRFNHNDARKILHLPLDRRDTDKNGHYFINANNPMMDAANLMLLLNSHRGERVSLSRSLDSSELESSQSSSQSSSQESKKDEKIKKLKALVKGLKQENKKLKQTSKRRKEKASSVYEENKMLRDKLEEAYTIVDVTDMLVKIGGMSRATLFSTSFHKKFPGAAKCLWGFENFSETLTLVECFFPDVNVNDIPTIRPTTRRKSSNDVKLDLPRSMTPLEKCLICRMFFRVDLTEEFLGLIFGKHI